MRPRFLIRSAAVFVFVSTMSASPAQTAQTAEPLTAPPYKLEAAIENPAFEWFFLVADAGTEQGIWAKHGLAPEIVTAAGSAAQLKERVDSGVKLGFVNTAEVLLARTSGTHVKIVAGYFGETTARIFVAASSTIQTPKELDRKKIGIVATTHTSY